MTLKSNESSKTQDLGTFRYERLSTYRETENFMSEGPSDGVNINSQELILKE